jgi:hypothetical protein
LFAVGGGVGVVDEDEEEEEEEEEEVELAEVEEVLPPTPLVSDVEVVLAIAEGDTTLVVANPNTNDKIIQPTPTPHYETNESTASTAKSMTQRRAVVVVVAAIHRW